MFGHCELHMRRPTLFLNVSKERKMQTGIGKTSVKTQRMECWLMYGRGKEVTKNVSEKKRERPNSWVFE